MSSKLPIIFICTILWTASSHAQELDWFPLRIAHDSQYEFDLRRINYPVDSINGKLHIYNGHYSDEGNGWVRHGRRAPNLLAEGGRSAHISGIWLFVSEWLDSGVANRIWRTSNGTEWATIYDYHTGATLPWGPRNDFDLVGYEGLFYLIGGTNPETLEILADVWTSEDGTTWTKILDQAPWAGLREPAAVNFAGKIWIVGGIDGNGSTDVWSSNDGVNWQRHASDKPWHMTRTQLVYKDAIWTLGDSVISDNSIWRSDNATSWTMVTNSPNFPIRKLHGSTVHKGLMWIYGGVDQEFDWYLDSLYSMDGITWTSTDPQDQLYANGSHDWLVTFKNALMLFQESGYLTGFNINVHRSVNGLDWEPIGKIVRPIQLVEFGEELLLFNGSGLWRSTDGSDWAERPGDYPWEGRTTFVVEKLEDRLLLIGGRKVEWIHIPPVPPNNIGHYQQVITTYDDVWASTDTVNWTQIADDLPDHGAFQENAISYNGIIYGILADSSNSIYNTTDGIHWEPMNPAPNFDDEFVPALAVFKDRLWMTGGTDMYTASTGDNQSWQEQSKPNPWLARNNMQAVEYDGSLWIVGGDNASNKTDRNDVWRTTRPVMLLDPNDMTYLYAGETLRVKWAAPGLDTGELVGFELVDNVRGERIELGTAARMIYIQETELTLPVTLPDAGEFRLRAYEVENPEIYDDSQFPMILRSSRLAVDDGKWNGYP